MALRFVHDAIRMDQRPPALSGLDASTGSSMSDLERCTTVFRGRVQGVGFRMTTHGLAQGFDVTGWVRNERDGSVRMVVEGHPDEIKRFHDTILERMGRFITDHERTWSVAEGIWLSFEINYDL